MYILIKTFIFEADVGDSSVYFILSSLEYIDSTY